MRNVTNAPAWAVSAFYFSFCYSLAVIPTKATTTTTQPTLHMPKEIKSLVACSQDVLARHLDCKTMPLRNALVISAHPCSQLAHSSRRRWKGSVQFIKGSSLQSNTTATRSYRANQSSKSIAPWYTLPSRYYLHLTWIHLFAQHLIPESIGT